MRPGATGKTWLRRTKSRSAPGQNAYWRSRLGARPRGHLGMPAFYVAMLGRHFELGGLHEVDRDQGGDVGNRIMLAGNEGLVRKLAVEDRQEYGQPRLVASPHS